MITYFSYGSNMNPRSLRAKGIDPGAGIKAVLRGWQLRFDVQHWFPHEGGVANIQPMQAGIVHGVLFSITAADLERLDCLESLGVGYKRVQVDLETEEGACSALTYEGMADFLNPQCLPSRRYLNLLVEGAQLAGLDRKYTHWLHNHQTQPDLRLPPFQPPAGDWSIYPEDILARESSWTALCGHLFSMEACRWQHQCLLGILAGRDTTLFHLRRLDSSRGDETLAELLQKRLDQQQWHYLNVYLHAYGSEYLYRGRIKQQQCLSGF
jgi:sulfite reductase (NADPH) flavoprotein alpha-component